MTFAGADTTAVSEFCVTWTRLFLFMLSFLFYLFSYISVTEVRSVFHAFPSSTFPTRVDLIRACTGIFVRDTNDCLTSPYVK